MTSVHLDPAQHGHRFGDVIVTVDVANGDCTIHAPRPGPVGPIMRRSRFNSLDEIQGAYQVQIGLAATDPLARDIAHALKFAGERLKV